MLYGAGLKMFWHPPLHCHLVILHELPLNIICLWSKPSWHGCYSLSYFSDSSEKPIVYASCKLTKAERNYARMQKLLGINYSGQKYHSTDLEELSYHKPLLTIFHPIKGVPEIVASCLHRQILSTTCQCRWTVSFSSDHWQNRFRGNWPFGDCVSCGAAAVRLPSNSSYWHSKSYHARSSVNHLEWLVRFFTVLIWQPPAIFQQREI